MELLEGRLPCSEKYFNEVVTAAEQASLEAFEAEQIGVESRVFLKELREQL